MRQEGLLYNPQKPCPTHLNTMLKKIKTKDLQLGMYLQALCGSWMAHPFWRSRFVLTDPDDIRRIRDSGIAEAWIDVAKGLNMTDGAQPESETLTAEMLMNAEIGRRVETPKPASMSEELQRAAMICAKAKLAVVSMFQEVRMGKAISALGNPS